MEVVRVRKALNRRRFSTDPNNILWARISASESGAWSCYSRS